MDARGYLWGGEAEAVGNQMGDIQWLLDIIRGLGIAGGPVFAVLWWLERTERQAAQKEARELLVQNLTILTQATNSIVEVTKAVAVVGSEIKGMNGSVAQVTQVVRSFSNVLKRRAAE